MAESRNDVIRRELGWFLKPPAPQHDHTYKPAPPPPEKPKGTP